MAFRIFEVGSEVVRQLHALCAINDFFVEWVGPCQIWDHNLDMCITGQVLCPSTSLESSRSTSPDYILFRRFMARWRAEAIKLSYPSLAFAAANLFHHLAKGCWSWKGYQVHHAIGAANASAALPPLCGNAPLALRPVVAEESVSGQMSVCHSGGLVRWSMSRSGILSLWLDCCLTINRAGEDRRLVWSSGSK